MYIYLSSGTFTRDIERNCGEVVHGRSSDYCIIIVTLAVHMGSCTKGCKFGTDLYTKI